MKTILQLVLGMVLALSVRAGQVTLRNDLAAAVHCRVVHDQDTLLSMLLEPGQIAVVKIDERRMQRPVLLVQSLTSWGSGPPRGTEMYALPKSKRAKRFEMSWFLLRERAWGGG